MKMIMAAIGLLVISALLFFLRSVLLPVRVTNKEPTVRLAGQTLQLEVANTIAKRARGLSGRATLAEGWGMLFLFAQPLVQTFWMREMHFPIDIVWVRGDEIIGFVENALPPRAEESPATFTSLQSVDKVLEVNAGFVARYGVKIGDTIQFNY